MAAGQRDAAEIRASMASLIAAEDLAVVDYVSVADVESLEELSVIERAALVSLAVRFGGTRLIDNVTIEPAD